MNYRTPWYLCHRIREAMEESVDGQLKGIVEGDETYVGGKYDRRRKRNPWEKPAVIGLIERKGKVEARTIPTPSKQILVGIARERVSPQTRVITDRARSQRAEGSRNTGRHC